MKRIAIICFTDYTKEPRVLRTINALKDTYNLTIYSSKNKLENLNSINIDSLNIDNKDIIFHKNWNKILQKLIGLFLKIILRYSFQSKYYFKKKYWSKQREKLIVLLKKEKYDCVIGHGIYSLPLLANLNCKTIFNAHEYYLLEFEENENWLKYTKPYYKYILDSYLKKASFMFCVTDSILKKYQENYLINGIEITNATKYYNIQVKETTLEKIKLIHHGGAVRSRKIETMASVMQYLPKNYELTFMLTQSDIVYLNELKQKYKNADNIKFITPVDVDNIANTCNHYDIGLYILPPVNYNSEYALPNKLFEFMQARLCLAISPNPDMKNFVEQNKIGAVAKNYSPEVMAETIKNLKLENINYYKYNSNIAANKINAEKNNSIILQSIKNIL